MRAFRRILSYFWGRVPSVQRSDEAEEAADFGALNRMRVRKLMEQLSAAPVVDVVGVVDMNGCGGGSPSYREDFWKISFTFFAWRISGAPLQTRELVVRRHVTEREYNKLRRLIRGSTVLHIRARVVAESMFERPDALLEKVIGEVNSDSELNEQLVRMKTPVTIEHPVLGTLTLDRGINQFIVESEWRGRLISLKLSGASPSDVTDVLQVALAIWENQESWHQQVLDCTVQELLPLKNDTWLDDAEVELTAEQFLERMTLTTLSIESDGSFEFWHDDGDMFWGHSIVAHGNLSDGISYAELQG